MEMCKRCIFDESIPSISFDDEGICNYCRQYDETAKKELFSKEEGEKRLRKIIREIKKRGEGKKYDCLIGLSGGVDSSYVAYLVKQFGLRPLAVHLDNGWNSELSAQNIKSIVEKLNIDLYTHVINWEEFKDMQISFLKASVVDIEMLTDHAIKAIMIRLANNERIKYYIGGSNIVTEAIMPDSWSYAKWDYKNIKAIQKKFGNKKIRTFPHYNLLQKIMTEFRLKNISILNYIDYNKTEAVRILEREFDWKNYGGKHYESIFTRFYQTYILPVKFNADKRKAHLSTLICSGQISRDEALKELDKPIDKLDNLEREKAYVLKKLNLNETEFASIMSTPIRSHLDYPNSFNLNLSFKRIKMLLINK